MRCLRLCLSLILCAAGVSPLGAQAPAGSASLSFDTLKDSVVQAADTGAIRELSVRSTSAAATPSVPAVRSSTFTLLADRRGPGRVRRERNPQLSDQSLVVIVRDSERRDLSWQIVPNPWVIRLEVPDATGRLSGQVIRQTPADWSVTVPDLPGARSVGIYEPRWNGDVYLLDPLGDIQVP